MARRTTGEGTIYRRKDENGRDIPDAWVAQVTDNGKRHTFTGRTRKAVKDKLEAYKTTAGIESASSDILFGDFVDDWLVNVKQRTVKPTTYDRLECTANNQILPYLKDYRLSELTYEVIQTEVINRAQDNGLSYSTIKKAYNLLNDCIGYAIFPKEFIFKNPMLGVTMPSAAQFESKEIRYFSDEEIKRFKAAALATWGNGEMIYPLGWGMILMLNTGVRVGEALAWRWSDYDDTNGVIKVSGNLAKVRDRAAGENAWKVLRQTPKTEKGKRTIPVNTAAKQALEKIRELRYYGKDSPILAQSDGSSNTLDNYTRTFEAIVKRAGIEPCGIHTLRHTFATQLIARGTDIQVVSSLLGHASVEITYNIYVHVLDEQSKKAVARLSDI